MGKSLARSRHNRQSGMPVEHTERDGRDGEEVHGRDGFSMVSQKDEPTFGGLRISRCSADPTGDRSLGHVEAKLDGERALAAPNVSDSIESRIPNRSLARPSSPQI